MKKYPFLLNDTLILRTSLLPLKTLNNKNKNEDKLIRDYWNNNYVKNGILLASYDFYIEVEKYLQNNTLLTPKRKKIQQTFFKYFSRMCTRSTPFGLFASVTPISVEREKTINVINLEDNDKLCLEANLHFQLLTEIVSFITKKFRINSKFKINRSLSYDTGKFNIAIAENINGKNIYLTQEIDGNDVIEFLLNVKNDVFDYGNLIQKLLHNFPFYSEQDIRMFINDCIDTGIIVNAISVTGRGTKTNHEVIYDEIKRLDSLNQDNSHIHSLLDIFKLVNELKPHISFKSSIDQIISILKNLNISYNQNKILFINSYRDHAIDLGISMSDLSQAIMSSISVSIRFLSLESSDNWYKEFKKRFKTMYGDAMMPFYVVFDPLIGLNYPLGNRKNTKIEILLTELPLNKTNSSNSISISKKENFWYQKYIQCLTHGKEELIIEDEDLLRFSPILSNKSYTFSMMASIIKDPNNKDSGSYINLKKTSAGSALGYVGRFSNLHETIYNLCKEISNFEEDASYETINAEITHIPDPSIGDILFHQSLHKYEIPYLVNSCTDPEFIIDINDLLLGIRDEEFVIYSKKHDKYVNPILSNAYNFSINEHPAFMFLCDFQHRKSLFTPNISIGSWCSSLPFFPRIRYKNIVFSPKSWIIDNIKFIANNNKFHTQDNVYEYLESCHPFLPKQILIGYADQLLYINFDDKRLIKLFITYCEKQLKKGIKKITATEFFIPKGEFTNEIVLTFNYDTNA